MFAAGMVPRRTRRPSLRTVLRVRRRGNQRIICYSASATSRRRKGSSQPGRPSREKARVSIQPDLLEPNYGSFWMKDTSHSNRSKWIATNTCGVLGGLTFPSIRSHDWQCAVIPRTNNSESFRLYRIRVEPRRSQCKWPCRSTLRCMCSGAGACAASPRPMYLAPAPGSDVRRAHFR